MSDLDIDNFNIIKVECNHTNGLPIHASLLMFNSNMA